MSKQHSAKHPYRPSLFLRGLTTIAISLNIVTCVVAIPALQSGRPLNKDSLVPLIALLAAVELLWTLGRLSQKPFSALPAVHKLFYVLAIVVGLMELIAIPIVVFFIYALGHANLTY